MTAEITKIPTLYARIHVCVFCDTCGSAGCDEHEPRDGKIADLIWDVMRETGAEPTFMHDEHGQLDPDGVFLAIAQKLLATGLAADVENTKEGRVETGNRRDVR